jgi:hypothetical protein
MLAERSIMCTFCLFYLMSRIKFSDISTEFFNQQGPSTRIQRQCDRTLPYRYDLKDWGIEGPRPVGYIYYCRALFGHAVQYCMFLTCFACLGNSTNSSVTSLLRELAGSYVMIQCFATPRKLLLPSLILRAFSGAMSVSFRSCGWPWPIFETFHRIPRQSSTLSCLTSKMGGKDS